MFNRILRWWRGCPRGPIWDYYDFHMESPSKKPIHVNLTNAITQDVEVCVPLKNIYSLLSPVHGSVFAYSATEAENQVRCMFMLPEDAIIVIKQD